MNILIRLAGQEDVAAVVRLIKALAQHEGWPSPLDEAYACRYLAAPGNQVLLAERDGEVLGLLSYSQRPNLFHAGEIATIEELIVAEDGRGQGIGGKLVEHLLEKLQKGGIAEVSVTTMLDNEGAIRFYKAHGLVDEALYLERHFTEG